LDEVPPVPVQVSEDGDRAIGLMPRMPFEFHSRCPHPLVVPVELIGVEEEADAPTRLIAYPRLLGRSHGPSEEHRRLPSSSRRNHYPALSLLEVSVLKEFEADGVNIEGDGLVIVTYDEGDKSEVGHSAIMLHQAASPASPTLA
jgi:hypothetical protein